MRRDIYSALSAELRRCESIAEAESFLLSIPGGVLKNWYYNGWTAHSLDGSPEPDLGRTQLIAFTREQRIFAGHDEGSDQESFVEVVDADADAG